MRKLPGQIGLAEDVCSADYERVCQVHETAGFRAPVVVCGAPDVFFNLYHHVHQHTLRASSPAMNRFSIWQVCVSTAVLCSAITILLFIAGVAPLRALHIESPETKQKSGEDVVLISKFYPFRTYSAFGPSIDIASARNASREQLCAKFPKNLLRDIQPVRNMFRVMSGIDLCWYLMADLFLSLHRC